MTLVSFSTFLRLVSFVYFLSFVGFFYSLSLKESPTRRECLNFHFHKQLLGSTYREHPSTDSATLSLSPLTSLLSATVTGLKVRSEPLSVSLQSLQVLKGKSQPDVHDQGSRKTLQF